MKVFGNGYSSYMQLGDSIYTLVKINAKHLTQVPTITISSYSTKLLSFLMVIYSSKIRIIVQYRLLWRSMDMNIKIKIRPLKLIILSMNYGIQIALKIINNQKKTKTTSNKRKKRIKMLIKAKKKTVKIRMTKTNCHGYNQHWISNLMFNSFSLMDLSTSVILKTYMMLSLFIQHSGLNSLNSLSLSLFVLFHSLSYRLEESFLL